MVVPGSPYTKIAFEAIKSYLENREPETIQTDDLPQQLLERRACFVSLHKPEGALRGCIGTIEPREDTLLEEIRNNAISAATNDKRFEPLRHEELEDIEMSVDVLTIPEIVTSTEDLDPQIYGIIVSDGKYKRAVLLPSIPEIETVEQQIKIVKRKAGLSKANNNSLRFYRFTSTRYH